MALKGDLLSADLGNLLQMLALNRKRGTLTVQDRANPAARRRVRIDGETLRLAGAAPAPNPALLADLGAVDYARYATLRRQSERFGGGAMEYLKARGELDEAALREWRVAAVREELLEVFLWRELRFALDETAPPSDEGAPAVHLDALIMEAARRQDEWSRASAVLGARRLVLRRSGAARPEELPAVDRIVYDDVDGVRGLAELVASTGLSRFAVETACARLVAGGAIEDVPHDELAPLGDRLTAEGRHADALRVWRVALTSSRLDFDLHKRIAGALLETDRPAKACAHWRLVAGELARQFRVREALDLYEAAWKLLPTRFATLESVVDLLGMIDGPLTRDDRAALVDARRLLGTLQELGETERALALAVRLRALLPEDRDALATVARLNLKLGRRDPAAEAWLALAERHREAGDLRRALETLRTVAAFDPAGAKLHEVRIEEVRRQMDDERRRRGRGRLARLALASAAALGVWYAAYAWRAARTLETLNGRLADGPAEMENLGADYAALARWAFLTPSGGKASEKARALAGAASALRDDKRRRDDRAAADRAEKRLEAERRLAEGRRQVRNGRLEDAVEAFRRAAAVGARTDAEAAAAKELADVESYLAKARSLLADAEAVEAGDPDRAFRLRAQAARDYDLAPEIQRLALTVVIDATPRGAWLVIDDGAVEGPAPLSVPVRPRGALKIEARAPGCHPRVATYALPPASRTLQVVLERTPTLTVDLADPLTAATWIDDGALLVGARNGRLARVDVASGATTARFAPEAIETQRRAPLAAGGAALVVLEDGRARLHDLRTLEVRARTALKAGAPAIRHGDGFAAVDAEGRVCRIDASGVARPLGALGEIFDLASGDGTLWVAGAEGLGRCGPDGALVRVADGPVASVAAAPGGARFVREGALYSFENGAERRASADEDVRGVWRLGDGAFATRVGPRGLVVHRGAGEPGRFELPGEAAARAPVVDAEGGRFAVALENGWICVYDAATGRTAAGHACDRGAIPALRGARFADPRETGRLLLVDDG
ncbi:MAG TPA: DUF4388 domain-containing protein [Planctomycetota bacterium]|nr:DUF4388 domain-containing protein [Planctomycetota bacterium]